MGINRPNLSLIIPALNEERAIEAAYETSKKALRDAGVHGEYILINDGSVDRTGILMDAIAKAADEGNVHVIHNTRPNNIGGAFRQGVQVAQGEYVMFVPGDNEASYQAIKTIVSEIGKTDLVISYTKASAETRSFVRRAISRTYVFCMNTMFGLRLRYFNGSCLIRRALLEQLPPWTPGFAFTSEILIQLLKKGVTYIEVPIELQPRMGGRSKAFSFRNLYLIGSTMCRLVWRTRFAKWFTAAGS